MKMTEIRELSVDELHQKIAEARKELFEAKLKHSMRQLENTALLEQLKVRVARMNTLIAQKSKQSKTA